MPIEVIALAVGIFFARIADVSFGTLRMVAIMRGQKLWAWCFGFVEVLIWIIAVAAVLQNIDKPLYAITYSLGFATGGVVGIALEEKMALGKQVVRVFSRHGDQIASAVRELGFPATQFEGHGLSGPVSLLYLEVRRRAVPEVIRVARDIDPSCFYVVEDIRVSSSAVSATQHQRTWRSAFKRK